MRHYQIFPFCHLDWKNSSFRTLCDHFSFLVLKQSLLTVRWFCTFCWSEVSFSVSVLNGNEGIWSQVSNREWVHSKAAWKNFYLFKWAKIKIINQWKPTMVHTTGQSGVLVLSIQSEFRVRWVLSFLPKSNSNTNFSCIMAKCFHALQLCVSMLMTLCC